MLCDVAVTQNTPLQLKAAGSVQPVCWEEVPHFLRVDEQLPDLNLAEDGTELS